MIFQIEIEVGNDEMQTSTHIAHALMRVAEDVSIIEPRFGDNGTIYDVNGNRVGRWRFTVSTERQ
jgi:hypothetical protein